MLRYLEYFTKETGELRRVIGEVISDAAEMHILRDRNGKLHFIEEALIHHKLDAEQCEMCEKRSFTCTHVEFINMCGECAQITRKLADAEEEMDPSD